MKNYFKKSEKGITLVALVVTIVVLIILATISISLVFNENGILGQADKSKDYQANGEKKEQEILDSYDEHLANAMAGKIPAEPTEPVVTIGGTQVTLTKDNVYQYLGKKVTNYTGQSSVTIGGTTEYTVSTEYRLYYVDFDDKYKDGAGTIYLKAECTSNRYALPITDTSSANDANIKIKKLNPSLYKTGVTPPTATNSNMKAVTFLTNTDNWSSLADTSMSSNINYIVGAPPLEMMMDSYNTHYRLTGDTPDTSTLSASTARVKLFYKYPLNSSNNGYGVGPSNSSSASNGYYHSTSSYSVKTDTEIDSMYYPGSGNDYWLASPHAQSSYGVSRVDSDLGFVDGNTYTGRLALCPVVSLKSGVQLQLQ